LLAEIPPALQHFLEGVERVPKIVQAMKEFSHPGRREKMAVDLNRAIQSTLTAARSEWKYVAEVVTDLDAALPPVPCVPGEFNQVILNLIINAAHAIAAVVVEGGSGKGAIKVSTQRQGDWAEIRLQHTGAGIPEPIRARILEPFFTAKEVGQGLALARSVVVEKHGGQLLFETETGKGTTFIIRLPIDRSQHEQPSKAA
jgi:signal transduction histidine kinase